MDIDAVNVVETANIPDQQSSPSISKNGIIGVLLGVLLSVAIILIALYFQRYCEDTGRCRKISWSQCSGYDPVN